MVEVLEVFGRPTVKNELRGTYQWQSNYALEQVYTVGDVSGQLNQPVASRAELECCWMAPDGSMRVGKSMGPGEADWFVFKKLEELDDWFGVMGFPARGGSRL